MPCGISLSVIRSNRINELKRIMKEKTFTLIILHIAVFLAGWTGIFGRLISLSGLPLVWYRMIISVVVLFVMLAATLQHRDCRCFVWRTAGSRPARVMKLDKSHDRSPNNCGSAKYQDIQQ